MRFASCGCRCRGAARAGSEICGAQGKAGGCQGGGGCGSGTAGLLLVLHSARQLAPELLALWLSAPQRLLPLPLPSPPTSGVCLQAGSSNGSAPAAAEAAAEGGAAVAVVAEVVGETDSDAEEQQQHQASNGSGSKGGKKKGGGKRK